MFATAKDFTGALSSPEFVRRRGLFGCGHKNSVSGALFWLQNVMKIPDFSGTAHLAVFAVNIAVCIACFSGYPGCAGGDHSAMQHRDVSSAVQINITVECAVGAGSCGVCGLIVVSEEVAVVSFRNCGFGFIRNGGGFVVSVVVYRCCSCFAGCGILSGVSKPLDTVSAITPCCFAVSVAYCVFYAQNMESGDGNR
ncbi:MAG: hypothetical protein ACLUOF_06095 [Ruminococcus sp.]